MIYFLCLYCIPETVAALLHTVELAVVSDIAGDIFPVLILYTRDCSSIVTVEPVGSDIAGDIRCCQHILSAGYIGIAMHCT